MPTCEECGDELGWPFTCTYCERPFCSQHRVPESHHCVFAGSVKRPWKHKLDEDTKFAPTVNRRATGKKPTNAKRKKNRQTKAIQKRKERRSKSGSAGKRHRRWQPDSKSPDVEADGSIADRSSSTPNWREIRFKRFLRNSREQVRLLLLRGKHAVQTVVALAGFALFLYGALSAYLTWEETATPLIPGTQGIVSPLIAGDLLLIFIGTALVFLVTR